MKRISFDFELFYQKWSISHFLIGSLGLVPLFYPKLDVIWIGLMSFSFLIYLLQAKNALRQYSWSYGYANYVTTFRLLMIVLVLIGASMLSSIQMFFLLLVAIALDGVDGYVARKYRQTSTFGERLDMETDAFLVAALSLYHVIENHAPTWLLIPGLMRYFFGLAAVFLPQGKEITTKKFRATIAVIFFISLILPFIIPQDVSSPILQVAGSLIMLSFGLSIYGSLGSIVTRK